MALIAAAACGGSADEPSTGGDVATLTIEDLVVGTGATAAAGDTVTVRYVGTFLNGRQFDAGTLPPFALGAGRVIPGFEQGILGMKVGGRRRVTIPSSLAYGPSGSPPTIPPNTGLRFELELLAIAGK
jgi:peptidylprolyl isomerase